MCFIIFFTIFFLVLLFCFFFILIPPPTPTICCYYFRLVFRHQPVRSRWRPETARRAGWLAVSNSMQSGGFQMHCLSTRYPPSGYISPLCGYGGACPSAPNRSSYAGHAAAAIYSLAGGAIIAVSSELNTTSTGRRRSSPPPPPQLTTSCPLSSPRTRTSGWLHAHRRSPFALWPAACAGRLARRRGRESLSRVPR